MNVSRRVARPTSASRNGTPREKTIVGNDRVILRREEEEREKIKREGQKDPTDLREIE